MGLKVLTGVINGTGSDDLFKEILNLHKNILKNYQSVHAELRYSTSSATVTGNRVSDTRGRYLAMIMTDHKIISLRVVDTEHIAYSVISGSETTYPSE